MPGTRATERDGFPRAMLRGDAHGEGGRLCRGGPGPPRRGPCTPAAGAASGPAARPSGGSGGPDPSGALWGQRAGPGWGDKQAGLEGAPGTVFRGAGGTMAENARWSRPRGAHSRRFKNAGINPPLKREVRVGGGLRGRGRAVPFYFHGTFLNE